MDHQDENHNLPIPEDPIQRETEKLEESIKKEEKRVRDLEAKAVQNVNLYFIFQAVILASTAMASSLSCRKWWIPFLLSLLAAAQNFLSFYSSMFRVLSSREELDQNLADLAFMKVYKVTKAQVVKVLPGTPLNQSQFSAQIVPRASDVSRPKPPSVKRLIRRFAVYTSIGLFLGFTAVIMYGCHAILCSSGGGNCVKLC